MNSDEDKKQFYRACVGMFKAFNKPEDKDIVKVLYYTMAHMSIAQAEKCIELAISNEPKFPTPHALKAYASMIPPVEALRVEHRSVMNPTLAEDAMKMIKLTLSGKLSRSQIIEGMEAMNQRYPHVGWKSEAGKLARFYSMTEPVGSAMAESR